MNTVLLYLIVGIIVVLIIMSINKVEYTQENFKESSEEDVEEGASTYYDWGYKDIVPKEHRANKKGKRDGYCVENVYIDKRGRCKRVMEHCPIWEHPDIDKYVLKSSVPPCPDVSKFAKKSDLCPCVDMKDYIKKSEIPACPKLPDMRDYVLKSEVPACPDVTCPKCPICPSIPPYPKSKTIIKIQDHPDFRHYVPRSKLREVREKLRECRNRGTIIPNGKFNKWCSF